jgi:plastocyanin
MSCRTIFLLGLSGLLLGGLIEVHAQVGSVSGAVTLGATRTEVRVNPAQNRYRRTQETTASATDQNRPVLIWLEANVVQPANGSDPVILNQINQQFEPRLVVVRAGETVRVLNSDPIYHNVFSLSGVKRFDIGRRPRGTYEDVQFDAPGEIAVFCDIHPSMSAVILVLPKTAHSWTVTDSGSTFSLVGVPSGSYILHAYAPGFRPHQTRIEIARNDLVLNPILLEVR